MSNASKYPCEIIFFPDDIKFNQDTRRYQGCPTIEVTKGGRIYLGWYAGGTREPHMDNYNLLIYSDDGGTSWSDHILVIPSSYELNIHAYDIQLFLDPDGKLHIQWIQDDVLKWTDGDEKPSDGSIVEHRETCNLTYVDGYLFGHDHSHSCWEIICENPDAEKLEFSEPRYLYPGNMRCKPTFLSNGDWLIPAYDQLTDRYGYKLSSDKGKTYIGHYGSKKLRTPFDEAAAYEIKDGNIRLLARCSDGFLAESYSDDYAKSWSEAQYSDIVSADTRFFVGRLPSGRILLVTNDCKERRQNMTVALSEDDGVTWKYKHCIDGRHPCSYPDAAFYGDKIYLIYDHNRTGDREIIFAEFTEKDIIEGKDIVLSIISKPKI